MCNISAQESHNSDAVIRLFGKTISVKNDEKGDEFHRKEKRQFPFNGVQTVAKLIKTENTEENDPGRFHGKVSTKEEEEMKSETESSADSSSKGVIKADDGHKKVSPTPSKGGGKVVPCPRCNSMETKFCYYNNYNVNQPRHFCRNCRRYWTAGGTIRNIPVGAGRRKSKHFQGGLSLSLGVAGSVDDSDSNSSCGVQIFNQGFKVCEVSSTSVLGKILQ